MSLFPIAYWIFPKFLIQHTINDGAQHITKLLVTFPLKYHSKENFYCKLLQIQMADGELTLQVNNLTMSKEAV